MSKKQSLKIGFYPHARGWSGGEALYSHFALTEGNIQISAIDGGSNSAKMRVVTKFLTDGKKCKFLYYPSQFRFKGDEKDAEFFKLAVILSARKWKIWNHALEIFKSSRDKDNVLEYLQTEAVAEKLSQ